jgi:Zn finger protein HypA/HybF involved in hydrogenase expression
MKIEKECQCCGALYSIRFEQISPDLDPDLDEDQAEYDEESEFYPEFCPFCGSHESDEEGEDDE